MAEGITTAQADLRHSSLLNSISPEFKELVVVHVLNHKGELPNDVRRKLDSAINAVVKLPQFPNQPAIAPASFLKRPVLDQLINSEELGNAVIQAWFASKETLYAIVKGHLYSKQVDVQYPDFTNPRFQGTWSYEDWMSERESVLASIEGLNEEDVAVMLCFAFDRIPDGSQVTLGGQEGLTNHNVLDQACHYLESLPADASVWSSDILDFLAAVTEIIDRKKLERESAAAAQALDSQISKLNQHSDLLGYLELDLSSWEASPRIPSAEFPEVLRQLIEFDGLLEDYDPVPKMGASFSETRRLREEHDAVSHRIQVLKRELDKVLSGRAEVHEWPNHPELEHPVQAVEPQIDQGGGLSEIRLSNGILDFNPKQKNYTISLDDEVESLAITPVTTHVDVTVDITAETPSGEQVEGLESDRGTFIVEGLDVGQTAIFIDVFSEDPIYKETYTLFVTREQRTLAAPALSNDATLAGLNLLGMSLDVLPGVTQPDIYLDEQ